MSKRKRSMELIEIREGKKPMFKKKSVTDISQMLGDDLKFFDASFNTDATTTPTVVDLNSFAAGSTVFDRIGNKVAMRSLELRVRYSLEIITTNILARFVVVYDKNSNTAAPTWTQVFDAATIESQRLVNNRSRFTILMDKVIAINQTSGGGVQKGFFKKYIKLKDPSVQFASFEDSSNNQPVTGAISLMYISDVAAGTTDLDVVGTCRLRFVG